MNNNYLKPDYVFETSWEICNKVGGINTVVVTKAMTLVEEYKDNLIIIGPDVWRETEANPDFIEDKKLYRSWRKKAQEEDLRVRIGRYNIKGKPIVFLVDFSPFIQHKDFIFKKLWEDYKVDSISGQRDYIEPAIFGYVAGKVIESFYKYNLTIRDKVLAHFHEWMTGTGVLYLKKYVPQVANLFTVHATVVGRAIAADGQPLYDNLQEYNATAKARDYNIVSKHSLEKTTANNADCFTTVSEITASECEHFLEKKVDFITPNGFNDSIIPKNHVFDEKRQLARQKLKAVAEAVLGYQLEDDLMFIFNSGRYEFLNKGIDSFIRAIDATAKQTDLNKQTVAFILVPTDNYGPRQDVLENMQSEGNYRPLDNNNLTHNLHDAELDPIFNEIKDTGIKNNPEDRIKLIYVPASLRGNDGIFDLPYYDVLIGMDLGIFPSYYEPWGYTPLESIAFHVPTVTTNLAGIGMWVSRELVKINEGIDVFDRNVGKDPELIEALVNKIIQFTHKSDYDIQRARENAATIAKIALWDNLIKHYYVAYDMALKQTGSRSDRFVQPFQTEHQTSSRQFKSNKPNWQEFLVQPRLPAKFEGLNELANNLWWTWNYEAVELFEIIDPELWEQTEKNPILLLKKVSHERYNQLLEDEEFLLKYNLVYTKFNRYVTQEKKSPQVAYFSMEYGLANILPIYSGGLGVLAGDYLKEASDSAVDMVAVGFLYKKGYFTQQLSIKGEQTAVYQDINYTNLPIHPLKDENGEPKMIQVAFPGRVVYARIWRVDVGRIPLYLLDTDLRKNSREDREISHTLYGGDSEHRLKQEMLLGIGGIRALETLNIEKNLYHCNEGHAAFIGLERLRRLIMEKNYTFSEALEIVRASTLFTTHTPVPAGHDSFSEDLIMIYMGHYPDRLKITWEDFINLGKIRPGRKEEDFSMSHLAVNLSQEVNGVSRLHGEVTKHMFNKMWDGYFPEELHIGYVTNGVHYGSWTNKNWRQLYEKQFGKNFLSDMSNPEHWNEIYQVDDATIWNIRRKLRKRLVDYIKTRLSDNWIKRNIDPKRIIAVRDALRDDVLTIGFARRFATYKRAHLLFNDVERLAKIVSNTERPIQIIYAGKAHPADQGGQDLIKRIVEISNRSEFIGKVIFLQNYNIELAKMLVQGVDVWLNTPTRPLEASGTSGMKAILNGVLNFSVLDGWWAEGYRKNAGWALPEERSYGTENQYYQDELDAAMIYGLLEEEVIPAFYNRDSNGIPTEWIRYVKNCIANIAPHFTTKRMLDDYIERFYTKLEKRMLKMHENDYELAKRISSWKKKVYRGWESIEVTSMDFPTISQRKELHLGEAYEGQVVLDLHELSSIDVGLELVVAEKLPDAGRRIVQISEMERTKVEDRLAYYKVKLVPPKSGVFNYGLRIYPKNEELPHRQDFGYLRWL